MLLFTHKMKYILKINNHILLCHFIFTTVKFNKYTNFNLLVFPIINYKLTYSLILQKVLLSHILPLM